MLDNLTTITFFFDLNEKNQTSLNRVSVTVTLKNNNYFPNCSASIVDTPIVFLANESLFNTDRSNSYRCNSKTKIDNFQSKNNVTIKSIDIEELRIQPFIDEKTIFNDYASGTCKR